VEAKRAGRAFAVGMLTDDNKDGVIDGGDHPVLIQVRGGEAEAFDLSSSSTRWSVTLPASHAPSAVKLVDPIASGRPGILIGDGLWSAEGKLILDGSLCAASASSSHFDFNGDRVADRIGCEEGAFAVRDGLTGSLLKGPGHPLELAEMEQRNALCFDVVLAYPRIQHLSDGAWQVTVRVGNAGGESLPAGLNATLEDMAGHILGTGRTLKALLPDGDADLIFTTGSFETIQRLNIRLDPENHYFEASESNNTLEVELKP
jgi:hypothetical protein